MSTIINTPSNDSSGMSLAIVVLVLLVIVGGVLFFVYGLPAMQNTDSAPDTTNIKVELPPVPTPTPAPQQ